MLVLRNSIILALAIAITACSNNQVKSTPADISFIYTSNMDSPYQSSGFYYDTTTGKHRSFNWTVGSSGSKSDCQVSPSAIDLARLEAIVAKSKVFDEPQVTTQYCDFSIDYSRTIRLRWRSVERNLSWNQCKEEIHSEIWQAVNEISEKTLRKCKQKPAHFRSRPSGLYLIIQADSSPER
jgi:hypothetical protein